MHIDLDIYEQLLSTARIRESTKGARPTAVETGSDRGRIVFSSAFRRLQQKAQVFPLESNAAVRTRLTHSVEVAHTGRYLAQEILYRLRKASAEGYKLTWLSDHEQSFVDLIEAACLIHDIGNPPFGHFGEEAIKDWFRETGIEVLNKFSKNSQIPEDEVQYYIQREYMDFLAFDGNPQGLRLVTRLQGYDGQTGLNLTSALLAAYLKYACPPYDKQRSTKSGEFKKAGYFSTEEPLARKAQTNCGIRERCRHPLSYVMEAADDISYCMSDIEDGIEKNIVDSNRLFQALVEAWEMRCKTEKALSPTFVESLVDQANREDGVDPFIQFKTSVINQAVSHAANEYCTEHETIISGLHLGLVRGGSDIVQLLEEIKRFVRRSVFRSSEAESIELAGYATIKGLLTHFSRILEVPEGEFHKIISGDNCKGYDYEFRLTNRLAPKARKAYLNSLERKQSRILEWHLRAHLIVDYISGMTDDFAVQTYQLLNGIRVGE